MKKEKEMSLKEVAQFIASHAYHGIEDPDEMQRSEEARVTAYHALNKLANALVLIGDDGNKMEVSFSENIGKIMNNDDVSGDIAGQRYYTIIALTHAIAATAKEQVDDGYSVQEVITQILDSLTHSLQSLLDINIEVGSVSPEDIEKFRKQSDTNNNSMLS